MYNWNRTAGRALAALAALVVIASGCTDNSGSNATSTTAVGSAGRYEATIRRTTDGVPHITSKTVEGVLFGQGWASSEDHACTLLDQVIKVQSKRAETYGAGDANANIDSDFAWKA